MTNLKMRISTLLLALIIIMTPILEVYAVAGSYSQTTVEESNEEIRVEDGKKETEKSDNSEDTQENNVRSEESKEGKYNTSIDLKPVSKEVLAGQDAAFELTTRFTGSRVEYEGKKLEIDLKSEKLSDSLIKDLSQLKIAGVVPVYNEEENLLSYDLNDIEPGKTDSVTVRLKTENGTSPNGKEIEIVVRYIDEPSKRLEIEKEAKTRIKASTKMQISKEYAGVLRNGKITNQIPSHGDTLIWTIDYEVNINNKEYGNLFIKEGTDIVIEDIVDSKQNFRGVFKAGKIENLKDGKYRVPAPSLEEQSSETGHTLKGSIQVATEVKDKKHLNYKDKKTEIENKAEIRAIGYGDEEFEANTTSRNDSDKLMVFDTKDIESIIPDGKHYIPAHMGPIDDEGMPMAYKTEELRNYKLYKANKNSLLGFSFSFPNHGVEAKSGGYDINKTYEYYKMDYEVDKNLIFDSMDAIKDDFLYVPRTNPYGSLDIPFPESNKPEYNIVLYTGKGANKKQVGRKVINPAKGQRLTRDDFGLKDTDRVDVVAFEFTNAPVGMYLGPLRSKVPVLRFKVNPNVKVGTEVYNNMRLHIKGKAGYSDRYQVSGGFSYGDVENELYSKRGALITDEISSYDVYGDIKLRLEPNESGVVQVGKNKELKINYKNLDLSHGDMKENIGLLLLPYGVNLSNVEDNKDVEVIDDFKGTGRQLLAFKVDDIKRGTELEKSIKVDISKEAAKSLSFEARLYPNIDLDNKTGIESSLKSSDDTIVDRSILEGLEEEIKDLNFFKKLLEGKAYRSGLASNMGYSLLGGYGLTTNKLVSVDGENWKTEVRTLPERDFSYKLSIKNETNKAVSNLKILDVFPSLGDKGITDNVDRGSELAINDLKSVEVYNGEGKNIKNKFELYYSSDPNIKKDEFFEEDLSKENMPDNPEGASDPKWEKLAGEVKAGALKLQLKEGHNLDIGEEVVVVINMKTPNTTLTKEESLIGWNSFAVASKEFQTVEPRRVGVRVVPINIEKSLLDLEEGARVERGDLIKYRIKSRLGSFDELSEEKSIEKVDKIVIKDILHKDLDYVRASLRFNGDELEEDKYSVKNSGNEISFKIEDKELLEDLKNADIEIDLEARVKETASVDEELDNMASIEVNDGEELKSKKVKVKLGERKFKAEKLKNKHSIALGEDLEYTIRVENTGSLKLKNLEIVDELAEGLDYVKGSLKLDGKSLEDPESNTIKAVIKELDVGEIAELSFTVIVSEDFDEEIVSNKAIVTDRTDPEKPVEEEPEARSDIRKFKAEKLVNGKKEIDKVKPGDELEYTIRVENIGIADIEDVKIKDLDIIDDIPEELEFVEGSVRLYKDGKELEVDKDYSLIDGEATKINIKDLRAKEVVELKFKVIVKEETEGKTIINTAVISDKTNPDKPVEEKPSVPVTVAKREFKAVKKVNKELVKVGEELDYSIEVENTGNVSIKNLEIVDELPEGLDYVKGSLSLDGEALVDPEGKTIRAVIDELKVGELVEISFKAKAQAAYIGKEIVNTAVITDKTNPDKPVEEKPSVPVTVIDRQFTSKKKVDKEVTRPGEELEYTIEVKNTGNVLLEKLEIEDKLPEGLDYVKGSLRLDGKALVDPEGNTIAVVIDKLEVGQTASLSFKALVSKDYKAKDIENIAKIVDPEDPDNPKEPGVKTDLKNFKAMKKVDKKAAKHGEELSYIIEVENTGSVDLEKLEVEDKLPEGLDYVKGSLSLDGEKLVDPEGDTIVAVIDKLEVGQTASLSFKALVKEDYIGKKIENIASVVDPEDPDNPREPTVKTDIRNFDVEKLVNKKVARPGEELEYTIRVKNTGNLAIKDLKIKDEIPEGLEFVKGSMVIGNEGLKDPAENIIDVEIKELKVDEVVSLIFKARVREDYAGKTVVNIASVVDPEDPDNPREPSVKTDLKNFKALKKVDKEVTRPGQELEYTIEVENTGNVLLEKLEIEDKLPKGLDYVKGSLSLDGKALADPEGDTIVAVIDKLEVGQTVSLSFKVKVKADHTGEKIVNTASVVDPKDPDKPREPSVKTDIKDFKAIKKVDKEVTRPGQELEYTIEVENTGSVDLKNLEVEDKLPKGLDYVKGSLSLEGKALADPEGNTIAAVIDKLEVGQTSSLSFKALVSKDYKAKDIENIAKVVDPEDPDKPREPSVKTDIKNFKAIKKVDKKVTRPGQELEYTIEVENTGNVLLEKLEIEDKLPKGLDYVKGSLKLEGETLVDPEGNTIVAVIDKLEVGQTASLSFKGLVSKDYKAKDIENIASVVDPEDPDNPREPSVKTDIKNFKAIKKVDKEVTRPGQDLEYTIEVSNTGSVDLEKLEIEDKLPEGLNYVKGSLKLEGERLVDPEGNTIRAVIDKLEVGQTVSLSFKVRVKEDHTGERIVNTASVVDPEDPDNPREPSVKTDLKSFKAVKKVDKEVTRPGQELEYTIEVENTGNVLLEKLEIEDKLPEGLDYVKGSLKLEDKALADPEGNTIAAVIDKLEVGQTSSLSFKALVSKDYKAKDIENIASVVDPEDPDNPREPSVKTDLKNFKAIKKVDKEVTRPGQELEYTIEVENTGNVLLEKLEIEDKLAEGLDYVKGSLSLEGKALADPEGNTIAAVIDKLEVGQTVSLSFKVRVKADHTGEKIVNTASVVDPEDPDNPREPSVKTDIKDFKAIKKVDKEIVRPGQELEYTIEVENTGSVDLERLEVEDKLSEGLDYVKGSLSLEGKALADPEGNTIAAVIDKLEVGQTVSLSFKVKVKADHTGERIVNTASVVDPEDPDKPREPSVKTDIKDFKAVKKVDKELVKPGQELEYTIEVSNTGSVDLENLEIEDKLVEGLDYVEGSLSLDGKALADPEGDIIRAVVDKLEVGQTVSLSFKVRVTDQHRGKTAVNIASVVDPEDPDNPRKPSVKTDIKDFKAVKKVDKKLVKPGQELEYTIEVSNTGSVDLENLEVEDKLLEGLDYVKGSLSLEGKSLVDPKGNTIRAVIDKLEVGQTVSLSFKVRVKADHTGKAVVNRASVVDPEDPDNPRKPSVKTDIKDFKAVKKVDKEVVGTGEELEYTIEVSNTGSTVLENLEVEDKLPEGLDYVKGSLKLEGETLVDPEGNTIRAVIDKLEVGQTVSLSFKALVSKDYKAKDIENIAKIVDPEDPDNPKEPGVKTDLKNFKAIKKVDKKVTRPGQELEYTIEVSNTGSVDLEKLEVEDKLPEGLDYVKGSLKLEGERLVDPEGNTIKAVIDKLEVGQTASLSFKVKVKADHSGKAVLNTASIIDPEDPDNPREPSVKTDIKDFKALKKVDKEVTRTGEELNYTIEVTNIGSIVLENLEIEDKLPEGLDYVKGSLRLDGKKSGVVEGDSLKAVIEKLEVGQTVSLSFKVKVKDGYAGKTIVNTASVVDPEDPDNPREPSVKIKVRKPEKPKPGKPGKPRPENPVKEDPKDPTGSNLPKTGYADNIYLKILGLVLVLVSIYIFRKRLD